MDLDSVYLVYSATDYEGLGYASVYATFESAFAAVMEDIRHYVVRDEESDCPCHALSIRIDELGDFEVTKLFNMEFNHPEREPVWSNSDHICISQTKVKGLSQ